MLTTNTKVPQENNTTTMWAITWMSFLWSTSSLMVFSILPAYLVDILKMGHAHIGAIEGVAIASSFGSKIIAGVLSDIFKNRKPLIIIGTIISALTKPAFALALGPGMIFGIRFSDRLSKGLRSAPTDALIADISKSSLYASNFGLRQALSTLGDVFGALIAMSVMLLSGNNYKLCFALSFVPAFLAILVLLFWVRPHPESHPRFQTKYEFSSVKIGDLQKFSHAFWWLLIAIFFLMLGRFSSAFLTLKAKHVGWSVALLPLLVIIKDIPHASIAWPSGKMADKVSRTQMLMLGLFLMILAQAVLGYVNSIFGVIVGIILVGLHLGVTQGLLKALLAHATPAELRGTAFSLFFLVSGVAILIGNTIAGTLSQIYGIHAPFLGGCVFSSVAIFILYWVFLRNPTKEIKKVAQPSSEPAL